MAFERVNLVIIATFVTLGALASQATSHSLYEASIAEKHEQWMEKYGRIYSDSAEKERRFAIFMKNVEFVEKFNNEGNKTYKLSINKFSDMTNEEFIRHHTGYKIPISSNSTLSENNSFLYQSLAASPATDVPTSMDWRVKGAVTGIKNHGKCGACWAFSAVAAVEGLIQIKTGQLVPLSEQQLVDCDRGNNGCNGGWMTEAFRYIIQNGGIASEENYQYQSMDMVCNTNKESEHVAQITGFEEVPPNSENDLLKAVSMQPVSVAIDAYGQAFQSYSSGVFSGDCGTNLTHAVTVIGYGTTEDGMDYWLLKNSWGENWGENGFMKILRNIDAPEGMCGLAKKASYPTAQVLPSALQFLSYSCIN